MPVRLQRLSSMGQVLRARIRLSVQPIVRTYLVNDEAAPQPKSQQYPNLFL